ncbi:MAG TPA: hypothetical protein PLK30_14590 [Blastocatellia bacterium]|nr:hypothetical protein [Blastocatellia bacterium]
MSPTLEQKLIELIEESKHEKAPAVQVVLHMLLGAHANGTQSAFAQWCCKFSPFQGQSMVAQAEVSDFPDELDLGD